MLTYGSLFSGYGGLDMGVQSVLGGRTLWHCEYDAAPSRILDHHWPDVPNLGDITAVDWTSVPRVDVLTGGSPCQDLSHAGRRAGMTEGTRSNLWVQMREAIAALRPRLVVWENVRGAYSAPADSALEPCPGCVGDPDGGPVLRALGRVLGDLASLGYDARWYGLRAADVGAPHGRFRVFLFATPADLGAATDAGSEHREQRRDDTCLTGALLPTPRATDGTKGGPNQRGSSGDLMLPSAVQLLPTPSVADALGGHLTRGGERSSELLLPGVAKAIDRGRWGDYAPAIARWEHVLGRPAPAPTQPGKNGNPRLSAVFTEWLMGLPDGHVTSPDIGLTRNQALKVLGNGVVWQQCAAATRAFLSDFAANQRSA